MHPNSVPARRRQVLAGAAALAACTATGGALRPARAATALRVAYIPILPMAQLFVIQAEGWAAEAGLELAATSFSSGPAMVQALASNRFDVAYIGIGPAMVAQTHGVDLKVVAANGIDQIALLGRGAFAAGFAKAASPAAAFAAFRKQAGRPVRIATLPKGSVPDTVLHYWLREVAHVDPADVRVLGFGENRVTQALLSGTVDAASTLEPALTLVQERDPTAHVLVGGEAMFHGQPGAVLAVTAALIKARPAAVQALVGLHVRATRLLRRHPHRAAADLARTLGKGLLSEATLLKAVTSPAFNPIADPGRILAATEKMNDYQAALDHIAKVPNVAGMFDAAFYAKAAKQGG
ncbi:MAG: ABC transporter substrate-binding protein [Rhodospirillales bacterium]|nr:ABC transporter substrate-binding protein [Rhodospirillales bacterium]